MKRKDLLIPVAMLALGAGIGFWTRDRQSPADAPIGTDTAPGEAATAAPATSRKASDGNVGDASSTTTAAVKATGFELNAQVAPSFAAAPLPPLDAKIADIYDTLKERARQGDGKAACRLAIELQQCSTRDFMLQGADRATRMMANRPNAATPDARRQEWESRMLDVAQRQIDYAVALDERCQGLSQDQVAEHVDWWRAAALSGHVPSMVHYAKGDGFRLNATLDNLDRLAAYRGEAERLMRAAAAAGSAEALQQLLLSYAPERDPRGTLLQQAIEPDPVEAAALLRLMQERGIALPRSEMSPRGDAPPSLAQLDPVEQARTEQRLAELRKTWPRTQSEDNTRRPPWEQVETQRAACDRDQFADPR